MGLERSAFKFQDARKKWFRPGGKARVLKVARAGIHPRRFSASSVCAARFAAVPAGVRECSVSETLAF